MGLFLGNIIGIGVEQHFLLRDAVFVDANAAADEITVPDLHDRIVVDGPPVLSVVKYDSLPGVHVHGQLPVCGGDHQLVTVQKGDVGVDFRFRHHVQLPAFFVQIRETVDLVISVSPR